MVMRLNWKEKFRFLCLRVWLNFYEKKATNSGWIMKEKNTNKSKEEGGKNGKRVYG